MIEHTCAYVMCTFSLSFLSEDLRENQIICRDLSSVVDPDLVQLASWIRILTFFKELTKFKKKVQYFKMFNDSLPIWQNLFFIGDKNVLG
jgi:hypothetical protein